MGAGLSDKTAGSIISVLPVSVTGSPQVKRGRVRNGNNPVLHRAGNRTTGTEKGATKIHDLNCYINNTDKDYIEEQIDKAGRHLNRMIMDCYKELFIIYYQRIEEFKKYTRHVDLSYIKDGKFYVEYNRLLGEAEVLKAETKKCVSYEEDYLKFEEACVAYSKLNGYIQKHLVDVQRIKLKNNGKKAQKYYLNPISAQRLSSEEK